MKIMVYTVLAGDYDELNEVKKEKNVDFYCWTNNPNIKSSSWKILPLENPDLLDFVRLNRKTKILGNKELEKNYDIVVYMDANVILRKPIVDYIKNECNLEKYDFFSIKHPDRNCIYEEAIACKEMKKDSSEMIDKTINFLKKEKFPEHFGLTANNFIVRKANSKKITKLLQNWWNMVEKYSKRDQLSFMYILWKYSYNKIQIIDIMWNNNKYFYTTEHKKSSDLLIKELTYKISLLKKENDNLFIENNELNKKINNILNSKTWKYVTRIQNIFNRFRKKKK